MRREKLTYLTRGRFLQLERELERVIRENIPGDFLEFGIALGGSAVVIATAAGDSRSFHGFDVFGMIPPPEEGKDDQHALDRYAVIVSGESTGIGGDRYYGYRDDLYTAVTAAFRRNGLAVDGSAVSLHKGLFEETWPLYRGERIAFAHVDCDWYEPVRFCLERIAERLSAGGAIVLDDYHDYAGCRRAADEFMAARPEFSFEDGENVVLRKAANPPAQT